jgi:4'-phosphopantetheinyl transferase EntD
LQTLSTAPEDSRPGLATALFCAKEAYYKCRYQVVPDPVGFQDVEVVLIDRSFDVRPTEAGIRAGRVHVPARGKFELRGEWAYAAAVASRS